MMNTWSRPAYEDCKSKAWEAELLALIEGALARSVQDIPPLITDDPFLKKAWEKGFSDKRNELGCLKDGAWVWYCDQ